MIKAIALGATTGLTFAIVSESYRVVRGASRACPKCAAPVGLDGVFRGEREPRSLTFQWAVNPLEWMAKERSLRRRQCCECHQTLDATSVIVNDRVWHRKCLRCTQCDQPLKGHRYRMLNNHIYDEECYQELKNSPAIKRSHTASLTYVTPDPTARPEQTRFKNAALTHGSPKSHKDVTTEAVRDAIMTLKRAKRFADEQKTRDPPNDAS